jgi:phage-related protein
VAHSISALKLFYSSVVKQPLKFKTSVIRDLKKLPKIIERNFCSQLDKTNQQQSTELCSQ